MAKRELTNLNVKVPTTMKQLLQQYVKRDLHTNISEFTREAIREKFQREAPDLYKQLFKEKEVKSHE
jgi:Arc/MetJ-type ribon-helix-helix transcriptional regulator